MKIVNYLTIIFVSLFLISCSKVTEPIKRVSIGDKVISYKPNENVDSLVIPPNLTKPSAQGIFAEVEEADINVNVFKKTQNIEIKRDKYRRWLLVELSPNEIWVLSKDFFRSFGFKIEKENQNIGLLETDYLEIETKVPDKSLGAIRAALAKALKTKYGLPIADKYRIRIEPTENPMVSELYLTLSSIGEVTNGAMRVWQPRIKDVELETEMLLKLMVYLGSNSDASVEKIQNSQEVDMAKVEVITSEDDYAVLVFPYKRDEAWKYLGWAIDELGIDVEDRDFVDGSFYIKVEPDRGYFSKLINTLGSVMTYQLILKESSDSITEVLFVDLSENNSTQTIDYSVELFGKISEKF